MGIDSEYENQGMFGFNSSSVFLNVDNNNNSPFKRFQSGVSSATEEQA